MEIYAFATENVDSRLSEVSNILHMLVLATYGIDRIGTIDEQDTAAFHALLDTAMEKIETLKTSMQPLVLGWENEPLMIIEGKKL